MNPVLRLGDFLHQFSEGGLIFAACKPNYVQFYSKKICPVYNYCTIKFLTRLSLLHVNGFSS